jgi:hypothetical protein
MDKNGIEFYILQKCYCYSLFLTSEVIVMQQISVAKVFCCYEWCRCIVICLVVLLPVKCMYRLPCREYKEALRQQRAHDGVYRPRMSGDGSQQTTPVSNELLKQDGSPGSSYSHQTQALINHTSHVSCTSSHLYLVHC